MTTGPGRETSGDGTSALMGRQSPSLDEALRVAPDLFTTGTCGFPGVAHWGVTCCRLEKMVLSMTGEALRRPTVGKSSV